MSEGGLSYAGLGAHLKGRPEVKLWLTLDEINAIISPHVLPDEASTPQFWANSAKHHPSRRLQWLDQGYKAYLEPKLARVRFQRASESEVEWTLAELRACVVAYRQLWLAQQAGAPMAKAALRRDVVAASLPGRSESAYEFRMQNITAVLSELGLPVVPGYPPLRNIGAAKVVLVELINEVWQRDSVAETPTGDPEALATRVVSARTKLARSGLGQTPPGSSTPQYMAGSTMRFVRDADVIAWVLEAAGGVCEVCGDAAPFKVAGGAPFLEVHHVRWLSQGGPDTTDNAVAACPNCHRGLHHAHDRDALRRRVVRKVGRLTDHPRRPVGIAGKGP